MHMSRRGVSEAVAAPAQRRARVALLLLYACERVGVARLLGPYGYDPTRPTCGVRRGRARAGVGCAVCVWGQWGHLQTAHTTDRGECRGCR